MNIPKMYDGPRWSKPERSDHAIANTIMEKWAECGHPQVQAWVDHREARGKCPLTGATIVRTVTVIRSNLVNGMPPAEDARRAA